MKFLKEIFKEMSCVKQMLNHTILRNENEYDSKMMIEEWVMMNSEMCHPVPPRRDLALELVVVLTAKNSQPGIASATKSPLALTQALPGWQTSTDQPR